jgi:hypothetical protein
MQRGIGRRPRVHFLVTAKATDNEIQKAAGDYAKNEGPSNYSVAMILSRLFKLERRVAQLETAETK